MCMKNIMKCLFLKIDEKIYTINCDGKECEVIKIKGEDFCEYTKDFWSMILDYLSYTESCLNDFCYISDIELREDIPPLIQKTIAEEKYGWNSVSIKETLQVLNLEVNLDIMSQDHLKLCDYSCMFPKDSKQMVAIYNKKPEKEKERIVSEDNDSKMTLFAKYFNEELQKDKKRNGKYGDH